MSRIGKNPVPIPNGVEVTVTGRQVTVKGPKGTLTQTMPPRIDTSVTKDDEGKPVVAFKPNGNAKQLSPAWGTAKALVWCMVEGVTKGYTINLSLIGVGYRANMQGKKLGMTLGYSHPIEMDIPEGLKIDIKDQTEITITGIDKYMVGQFAANVRAKRSPEPFKGKGVRYTNEHIVMKEGKKK
ncbi:MAG: 50S ribosomal protein L6 [Proteobacteria bacterium]|nr:50S ribosomal protein L6 [Pseudomonadota bacterium]